MHYYYTFKVGVIHTVLELGPSLEFDILSHGREALEEEKQPQVESYALLGDWPEGESIKNDRGLLGPSFLVTILENFD